MLTQLITKRYKLALLIFHLRKHDGIWSLKKHLMESETPNPILLKIYNSYIRLRGGSIGYNCQLDGIPCFPHGYRGVFISGNARIGRNVVIFQHVTIGSNTLNDSKKTGAPLIGHSVYIGAGAKIIGGITVGDNCRIGANAVVYEDMPPNSVAVQQPTRIIQKDELDNRFYSIRDGEWVYFSDGIWIKDELKKI